MNTWGLSSGSMITMKLRKYGRMGEDDERAIVDELARWGRGELGLDLTWSALEKRFGFTRSAMDRKPAIKEAYQKAKQDLANLPKTREEAGEEFQALQREVERLKKQVEDHQRREALWRERWLRIAYHIRLSGMQLHLIDRPAGGTLPDVQETAKILNLFDREIPPASHS